MPQVVIQPDGTAGKDADIRSQNPTTAYGGFDKFYLGRYESSGARYVKVLLDFDLSAIPAGAIVTSATLDLVYYGSNENFGVATGLVTCTRLTNAWTEATCTWNTRDGSNAWAGGAGLPSVDTNVTGSGTVGSVGANLAADIAALCQDAISNRSGLLSMLLTAPDVANNAQAFCSAEHATAANRPKVTVNYALPGGGVRTFSGLALRL